MAEGLGLRVARGLGGALGWLWHRLGAGRRRVALANVAAALPGLAAGARRRLVRACFVHWGRCLGELLWRRGPPALGAVEDQIAAARAAGRGVLVLTAHLGHFERLVQTPAVGGGRLWVVTRRFRLGPAQAAWARLRRQGAGLLPAGASARAALAALARNEVVAFVLDQHDPGRQAVVAPFFGRPAATSRDLARLARLSGAPVVPVFTWWDGARHQVAAQAPVVWAQGGDRRAADRAGTLACLAVVEDAIRAHPAQWLWMHRRWKGAGAGAAGPGRPPGGAQSSGS